MFRTQLYLTDEEKKWLEFISDKTGQSQSSLVRNAIDMLISAYKGNSGKLLSAFGIWQDYDFDYTEIRREADSVVKEA